VLLCTSRTLPRISIEYLERLSSGTPLKRGGLSAAAGDFRFDFA
jgi:hypothetical protein